MEFRWRHRHNDRLRRVPVGWNYTEVGAPCFPPDWAIAPDDVTLIRIATAYGACPPGSYPYRRPPGKCGYSPLVDALPADSVFEFTEQHRSLLTSMYWEASEDDELLTADPKRPYGDFTFYQIEMALRLGLIPAQKPADHDPMTPEIVEAMTELHFQMQPALLSVGPLGVHSTVSHGGVAALKRRRVRDICR